MCGEDRPLRTIRAMEGALKELSPEFYLLYATNRQGNPVLHRINCCGALLLLSALHVPQRAVLNRPTGPRSG